MFHSIINQLTKFPLQGTQAYAGVSRAWYYNRKLAMELVEEYIPTLKEFESLRLTAYKPAGEKPSAFYTIGYGHYGAVAGETITSERAEELLMEDINMVDRQLKQLLLERKVELSPYCYTALFDLVYNVGIGNVRKSRLLRMITKDKYDGRIYGEFLRWVYSGGKKLPGLVKRREWNLELWKKGFTFVEHNHPYSVRVLV